MKRYIIPAILILVIFFGYKFIHKPSMALADNQQKAIMKCIKKLKTLTPENVAACYHQNMPNSKLSGHTVTDQFGQTWDFVVQGTCSPDDDCRAHLSKNGKGFDILLWYDMSNRER